MNAINVDQFLFDAHRVYANSICIQIESSVKRPNSARLYYGVQLASSPGPNLLRKIFAMTNARWIRRNVKNEGLVSTAVVVVRIHQPFRIFNHKILCKTGMACTEISMQTHLCHCTDDPMLPPA